MKYEYKVDLTLLDFNAVARYFAPCLPIRLRERFSVVSAFRNNDDKMI